LVVENEPRPRAFVEIPRVAGRQAVRTLGSARAPPPPLPAQAPAVVQV